LDISKILEELRQERNRIDHAIAALEGSGSRAGNGRKTARAGNGRRKRRLTPEGRKRLSEMMKKRWAERKRRARAA
jgi:Spy/CpxP family protein refolding chaperone